MSTLSKKFISAALVSTTALWASGVILVVPSIVTAQTNSSADIQTLLNQITQLQAQLLALQGGNTGGTSGSCTFNRNLTVGSKGSDVSCLQKQLISMGYLNAKSLGYFGVLTKAAVVKWQKANGVSPAVGYFGPLSRAKYRSVASSAPTTGTPTGGPTTVSTTTAPTVVAPASGLQVGLSSQNPAAGSLISSSASAAARVPVLAVDLTAGTASGITVNQIKFTKTGVISDSSISGAYVIEKGKVLAQYTSIANGVINFPGLNLNIAAGQTRTLTLAIDPATGLSAGNTVGFSVASNNDIVSVDANNNNVNETGAFPLNGNIFTVTSVSNPSIASLTVTSSSIGSTVTAGTQNLLVGAWNFKGSNSKVWLKSINLKVIGSANKSDIRNVKLLVNGSQAGPLLPSVASDGTAYFDLSSATSTATLNTGSNNVQVFADVMGSPSFNFQFEILNAYDIYGVDSQYNVPVTAGSNVGTQVSISQGQITLTLDTNTPTGNIARGQSAVTLAKYDVYAAGEAVKIKYLDFRLVFTSPNATSTASTLVNNVSLVDDAGGQVGTTINTPPTANSCEGNGSAFTASYATSTGNYSDCFGTVASPINYIVPANTTRVLSLRADIQTNNSFGTVSASLLGNSSNLQGLISSQTASTGAVTGSALTLASNSLTVAKNTGVGTVTFSVGAQNVRVGSYAFTASSAEGVNVSNISVLLAATGAQFQNLKVKIGSTQFGNPIGVLANSATYSFSGTQFTVPSGGTTYVDVYADVLSSTAAGTKTALTTVSGCSASGAISYTAISCTSTAGQDVVVAGQASVTISADSAQAASDQLVMGSTQSSLASFRFVETSNIENVKVTTLNVFDQVATTSSVKSAFSNLSLYSPSSPTPTIPLGVAGPATTAASSSNPGSGYIYTFNFSSPIIVPQAGSVSLVLKGDVASYTSSGATDNTTHVFKIATSTDSINASTATSTVVALGQTSNATSAVTLSSPNGNAMTVLRSNLTFSPAVLGVTSGRAKSSADNLATLSFSANSAGDVAVNSVIVTFSGTAPSISTFLDGVTMIDENGNTLGTVNTTSSACNGTNTCSKTFNLGSTTAGQSVSKGTSRSWTLRANSITTQAGTANIAQTLTVTTNALTDIRYTDGLDTAASTVVSLPSKTVVPIQINSMSYSVGT